MHPAPAYKTPMGAAYCGDALELIREPDDNSVDLVATSPPFALQRQKEYGNKNQDEYVEWLLRFGEALKGKLAPTGSLVIDLGGAYQRGMPVRSLYNYKVLILFCEQLGYYLAEEFFWYNPARLPSPIEWVNEQKIRVKDAVNAGLVVRENAVSQGRCDAGPRTVFRSDEEIAAVRGTVLHAQGTALWPRHLGRLREGKRGRHPLEPAKSQIRRATPATCAGARSWGSKPIPLDFRRSCQSFLCDF